MIEDQYAHVIDVSFYQDRDDTPQGIDYERMRAAGVTAVVIRYGQDTYRDPDLAVNWKAAGAAGLVRHSYWFFEYRSWGKSALQQAESYGAALTEFPTELGYTLDVERPNASWPALPPRTGLLAALADAYEVLAELFPGALGWLYTNPAGIAHLAPIPDWLLAKRLWIAHYLSLLPGETAISALARTRRDYPTWFVPDHRPWPGWSLWQLTAKEDGARYGVESNSVDFNLFSGTTGELATLAGMRPIPPDEPAEPPEPTGPDRGPYTLHLPDIRNG